MFVFFVTKVDPVKLKKCIRVVLRNQFMSWLTVAVFYPLFKWRGMSFSSELPTFQMVLLQLISFILLEEIMFYYVHRYAPFRF